MLDAGVRYSCAQIIGQVTFNQDIISNTSEIYFTVDIVYKQPAWKFRASALEDRQRVENHVIDTVSYKLQKRGVIVLDIQYTAPVQPCPCPPTVRETKNDATEPEIAAESQNDPSKTGANRE